MQEKNIKHLDVIALCNKNNVHLTKQRKIIAEVINNSTDHPDVETIYFRSHKKNKQISLATVYRTLKLFEDSNVVIKHDFKHGSDKARYEPISKWQHNHLLDISTGTVVSKKIADKMGYKIVGYKLEIFGIKEACSKFKINK